MKKTLAVILLAACILTLTACGTPENGDTENTDVSAPDEENAELYDLIPMVMVNGTLYLDTGFESTAEARCGNMDGTITSTVSGSKKPAEDDQSNFGTGFDYQYGEEGTVELCMDGKWRIFATEKKRHEMQFPDDAEN